VLVPARHVRDGELAREKSGALSYSMKERRVKKNSK